MEWYTAGALMLGLVVALMALSIPVAFAFLIANVVGALVELHCLDDRLNQRGSLGAENVSANNEARLGIDNHF